MTSVVTIDWGFIFEVLVLGGSLIGAFFVIRHRLDAIEARLKDRDARDTKRDEQRESMGQLMTQLAARMAHVEKDKDDHAEQHTQLNELAAGHAVMAQRLTAMDGVLADMRTNQTEMRTYFTSRMDQVSNDVHRMANVMTGIAARVDLQPLPQRVPSPDDSLSLIEKLRQLVESTGRSAPA